MLPKGPISAYQLYFQSTPIFDGTVRENIVFSQEVSDEVIWRVLRKVHMFDVVRQMPDGLDTFIGEKGQTLSGGERQRLAFARLWFKENTIMILDEATSALDTITEEQVMTEVINLLREKTVVAIAHRLSLLKNFDKIMVLHNGDIMEQGTFSELLVRNSYFAELYRKIS